MSALHFARFRLVLGLYLSVHFVHLVPYAGELFSGAGMLPDPALNPTHRIFPNLLVLLDSAAAVQVFLSVLAVTALAFAHGRGRRWAAVLLWYGWACLWNRNFLISNPSLPYVGWLLLATALVPSGEPVGRAVFSREAKAADGWAVSPVLLRGAWWLLALGYSISGVHKLGAPSWRDGTAILRVLEIPLARDTWLRAALVEAPLPVLQGLTWSALALEVLFLPLALWSRTRPFAWAGLVGMHLGILVVVDFADLSLGMLMIHLFTFDPRWLSLLPRRAPVRAPEPAVES